MEGKVKELCSIHSVMRRSHLPQTTPYKPSEINSTRFTRALTLIAISLTKRSCQRSGRVLFVGRKICIKYGSMQPLSEATAMRYIQQNTSVPVPKVYCAFQYNNCSYIVMERLRGKNVSQGWSARSDISKNRILNQLRRMVDEMRSIPPPTQRVSAVDGGPIWDNRLPQLQNRPNPFNSIQDFHRFLRQDAEMDEKHFEEVKRLITLHESVPSTVCLTHSDLSSLNVLVSEDSIVGIVDWESAGWYPLYWEYTNAWHVNPQNMFWQAEVEKFLTPFTTELEMDQLRRKYFGDY